MAKALREKAVETASYQVASASNRPYLLAIWHTGPPFWVTPPMGYDPAPLRGPNANLQSGIERSNGLSDSLDTS